MTKKHSQLSFAQSQIQLHTPNERNQKDPVEKSNNRFEKKREMNFL